MLRFSSFSRLFCLLALAGLIAAGSVQSARAADITLKYAFFAPEGTFPGRQMSHWASEVEKRTGGKVKVQMFPGGSLLGAREMWDGVTMGITDIGLSAPSYDPGRFPLTSGMALPLGFPDATGASRALWELTKEFKPKEFEPFKVIAMFTSEPGYIQSRRPVRNASDLRGMRLRATGSGVPTVNALGASAVGMAMPEVPQATQTGVLDGVVTSREVLRDFRLAEQLKYVTDYPTVVSTFAAVMDRRRWEKLPDDVKSVIEALSEEMPEWTGNFHDQENVQGALKWAAEEHGLQVLTLEPAERQAWDQKLEPVVQEWIAQTERRGLPARQYVQRALELKGAE